MTNNRPTRRRFLRIMAAAPVSPRRRPRRVIVRSGGVLALGAEISIVFDGAGRISRQAAIERIVAEIERQEAIFSLQAASLGIVATERLRPSGLPVAGPSARAFREP